MSSSSPDAEGLRSMLMSFRLSELTQLLDFAGKNKAGRKSELQERSLSLLKEDKLEVRAKIKELSSAMYKSIGNAASVNPYSSNYVAKDKDRNKSSKENSKTGGEEDLTPPELPIGPAPSSRRAAAASKAASKARGAADEGDDGDDDDDDDDDEDEDDEDYDDDETDRSSDYSPSTSSESRTPSPEPVRIKRPPPSTTRSMRTSTREMSKASQAAAAAAATTIAAAKDDKKKKKVTPQKPSSSPVARGRGGRKTTAAEAIANSAAAQRSRGRGRGNVMTTSAGAVTTTTAATTVTSFSTSTATTTTAVESSSSDKTLQPSDSNGLSAGSSNSSNSIITSAEDSQGIFYPQYHRSNSLVSQAYRAGLFSSHGQSSPMRTGYQYEDRRSGLMYPTFPDVKLRRLPFYRVLATLMQPCSLQPSGNARFQEQKFSFFLSPTQVESIERNSYRDSATGRFEYKMQVQLRFSLLETSCEQDDNFPSSICVKVNNKMQSLPNPIPTNKPGMEPKRPPKPINITSLCRLSSTMANYLDISWAVDFGRGYTVSVYFVERLNSNDLMKQLKERGTRHPDYTKALIKEKLNDKDSDVSTMSCKVTLACPLGKMRITWPCRSSTCDHLQCFDASLYLMMNERKPKWLCPVCNKHAFFDNLLLDGFFKEVLGNPRLPSDDHEIVLHNNGSWDPLPTKRDPNSTSSPSPPPSPPPKPSTSAAIPRKVETFNITDDSSSDAGSSGNNKSSDGGGRGTEAEDGQGGSAKSAEQADKRSIDCITLDSDEDETEDIPLSEAMRASKRARLDAFEDAVAVAVAKGVVSAPQATFPLPPGSPLPSTSASQPQKPSSPQIICLDD